MFKYSFSVFTDFLMYSYWLCNVTVKTFTKHQNPEQEISYFIKSYKVHTCVNFERVLIFIYLSDADLNKFSIIYEFQLGEGRVSFGMPDTNATWQLGVEMTDHQLAKSINEQMKECFRPVSRYKIKRCQPFAVAYTFKIN